MAKTETSNAYFTGVGRRKTAVAQIRVMSGSGQFTFNGEKTDPHHAWVRPLDLVGKKDSTDVSIVVRGGGFASQDDAISLGIARALVTMDDTLKPTLRKAGLVTVDARVKERKKPGLKRARKAPQWSKR
ncbi:MAG TPA: 30S ribosomal protein S9 [Patescibacteria group bacterium]